MVLLLTDLIDTIKCLLNISVTYGLLSLWPFISILRTLLISSEHFPGILATMILYFKDHLLYISRVLQKWNDMLPVRSVNYMYTSDYLTSESGAQSWYFGCLNPYKYTVLSKNILYFMLVSLLNFTLTRHRKWME